MQDDERYEGKPIYEATIALLECLNAIVAIGFLMYGFWDRDLDSLNTADTVACLCERLGAFFGTLACASAS